MCNRSFFSGDLQRSVLNITAHYRSRLREDFDESGGSVVTAPRAQKEISAKRYSNFSVAFSSSRTFGLDNKSINNENSNFCNFFTILVLLYILSNIPVKWSSQNYLKFECLIEKLKKCTPLIPSPITWTTTATIVSALLILYLLAEC